MAWGISSIDDLLRFDSLSPSIQVCKLLLCMLGGNGNGLSFQVSDRFSFSCNF